MSQSLRQLLLLLWKNFILQLRRPIGTCFELLVPVAMVSILILAKVALKDQTATKCFSTFLEKPAPTFENQVFLPFFNISKSSSGFLAFYPSNAWTRAVVGNASKLLGNITATDKDLTGKKFASESEAAKEASDFFAQYYGAVIFEHSESTIPKYINYKIRVSHQLQSRSSSTRGTWQTIRSFPFFKQAGPRQIGNPDYSRRFLPIQYAIDTAITRMQSNDPNATVGTTINQFPFPSYYSDPFISLIRGLMPLLFTLAFIYTSIMIVKELVAEKQFRLKESMKMMGLSNWIHWLAWFLKNFIFFMISIILLTILIKAAKILEFTDWSVVLVFLICYCVSAIFFCFLISVFFSNAVRGMLFGAVLWLGSYGPYFVIGNPQTYDEMTKSEKAASCLLPNTCLGIGLQIIAKFEEAQVGVQWSNFVDPPTIDENFSLALVVLMMVVQCVVFWILTWYIEAVFPGDYGVPKPFYFLFTSSYWCGTSASSNEVRDIDSDADEAKEDFEEEPADLSVGVSIKSLKKHFSSATGKKLAVDGLSLKMYKGQITALLGHNGAGKTTTMSILTGLFPPTDGTAYVGNRSILTEMDKIRESLGLCPQHNVLFDRLTVKEHLKFFISLKGASGQEAEAKINAMLNDIQLADKADAQSSTLSGGMKRKLSCAIALIGDPEVVFLDEPTSGMDPSARRATWDLLQKHRGNKTMVLTTHFMDEADYLGDRIAIMADGKLRCCGTSLFLKKRYGVGYHLTMVKSPTFQESAVVNMIRDMIPNAKQVGNVGAEMSYILDHDSSKSFKDLFARFEGEEGQKLGIGSFGISITTLEEVFLKVGEGLDHSVAPKEPENQDTSDVRLLVDVETDKTELVSGLALSFSHFKAMFIKRFLHSKREKKAVVTQILLPLGISLLGLLLAKSLPGQKEDPARVVGLSSDLKTGVRGNAYFADYRTASDPNLWKFVKHVYNGERLDVENVKASSMALKTNNANSSIYVNGKSHAIGSSNKGCCNFEYFTLNANCKAQITSNKDLCKDTAPFGYRNCPACIDGTKTKKGDRCPLSVAATPLNNDIVYFSEVILEKSTDKKTFFDTSLAGITFLESKGRLDVRSWFSNQPLHTVAGAFSAVSNIMLAYKQNDTGYGIRVTNHPLPRNPQEEVDVALTNDATLTVVIFITMAICFVAASFITFIVQERSSKAKHIQFVSGVGSFSYWSATYCWDFINFLVPALGIVILFAAFQLDPYQGEDLGVLVLTLLLYGLSVLPFVYLVSFIFKSPLIAYSVVSMLLMITSLAAVIAIFICRIPALGFLNEAEIMHHVFLLFPTYAFPQSLLDIAVNYGARKACTQSERVRQECKQAGTKWEESALAWSYPGSGTACLYMALEAVVFFILVLLIEENFFLTRFFANKKEEEPVNDGDSDVGDERKRISSMSEQAYGNEALVMKNLTKVYRGNGMVAVDHLSLGVPRKECFGLLGVNGAGKTTTFGMLTGEHGITAGTAYLDGFNIETQLRQVQQRIGYCPQFDALVERLTGREMLDMFARLRGIPSHKIDSIVNAAIKQLNLSQWADKMCGTYSGGNKRKLSTALALVGNPPIIFLDEPTSGMDPASRRFLWNTLSALLTEKRSIILTSHSMEECEALCTRLVIMVNGKFKCLGSIQHLKSKYGQGFTLVIKVGSKDENGYDNYAYQTDKGNGAPPVQFNPSSGQVAIVPQQQQQQPALYNAMQTVKQFVDQHFPGAYIMDERSGMLQYQITNADLKWSYMFDVLETNAADLGITDYSLSQTSLEQVFINFAKHQYAEGRQFKRKMCSCF